MTPRRRAWVLNFDAEDELAHAAGATPSRATAARFVALAARVRALLAPDDVVLTAPATARLDAGVTWVGRAWCPTPRALRAWQRAGVIAPWTPALAALRAVNHRRFCADLGQTLPGARYVATWDELVATLGAATPGTPWLLKRAFGYAGRGRRKVTAGAGDIADANTRAWIEASLAAGHGLQVEPYVTRERDFAIHGYITRAGDVTLGGPTTQTLDAAGQWLDSVRAAPDELHELERAALLTEATRAAAALYALGYAGPYNVDAYRWRDAHNTARFNPRSEINARYSMGYAAGMGAQRPDLDTLAE